MNKTVCELFLGVARGTYRGLPRLFRLSWVDQLMTTRFSRYNLGGPSHDGWLNQRGWFSIGVGVVALAACVLRRVLWL